MATKSIHAHDLQYEHKLWANELKFCEEELGILESRLSQVVSGHQENRDALKKVERFQNQFIRGQEVLDDLKLENRRHMRYLNTFSSSREFSNADKHISDYDRLREKMVRFKELYSELKDDFHQFVSRA